MATLTEYAAPIEAKYGTGLHSGITGGLVTACSDTPGATVTVQMMNATAANSLPYPVSGDALAIARAAVLSNRK